MIQRTSREHVLKILKENQNNWEILDIGCNIAPVEFAQTVADVQNFSIFYKEKNKKFVLIKDKNLPFSNNQFDFVYASHVIEHVENLSFFISELKRISRQGYIELPTILEDNIVLSTNSSDDHKWMFKFDDVEKVLLVEKKKQLIEPFITHGVLFDSLRKNFRSSLVLELYWENEINYEFRDFTIKAKKPIFFSIIKKYFSHFIRKNKIFSVFTVLTLVLILLVINNFNF
jgi:ubiquinone/menaquinone biosynthesis C-methylase UbiE